MYVLDTHNEKWRYLHTIKFLFRRRTSGELGFLLWPSISIQPVHKKHRILVRHKLLTNFNFCWGMNVQSLFCVHVFKSSATVYLLLLLVKYLPSNYKGSCSADSQETFKRPIHLNVQYNCCVFTFYFKRIKIYTNHFFYFVKVSERNSQIRESTGNSATEQ